MADRQTRHVTISFTAPARLEGKLGELASARSSTPQEILRELVECAHARQRQVERLRGDIRPAPLPAEVEDDGKG